MFGRGKGRGTRLASTIQKLQSATLGEDPSSTEERSPSQQSSASDVSESSPEASVVPAIGGRGKLRQFVMKKPKPPTEEQSPSSGTSESGQSSPSEASSEKSPASEEGAVGGDVAKSGPSREAQAEVRDAPIENKVCGTEGRTFDVAVNYIRLVRKKDTGIYEYHVDFDPIVDARPLRLKILRSADVSPVLGSVFEFTGINIYVPNRLDEDVTTIQTTFPTDESKAVTVTITFVKIPPPDEMIPFYNIMFRRIMRELRLVQMQRKHYDPSMRIQIPAHKLEVWPGVVTAILNYDGGLMLNCDITHRILRTSTARDLLQEVLQHPDGKQRFRELAQKRLVGCTVLTKYNNKPYRVDDIEFEQNPQSSFTLSNGTEITYIDYFKQHWNVDIQDDRQPLLVNREKPRRGQTESRMICLIPELSYMTGLTDDIRSDFRAMKDIATHTRIQPLVRYQKLQQFVRNVNQNAGAARILEDWGLQLESNPLRTTARHIRTETLFFGRNKTVEANPKAEWGQDARGSHLLEVIPVERWVMIYTKRDAAKAQEFVQTLQQVSRNMGFSFANPRRVEIRDEFPATYCNAIKESTSGAQLVVMMTPGSSQREDRYSAIKRLCCSEIPIPSQVVRANTLQGSKVRSVCQNIALQITCKLGGQLWGIKIPFNSCMIVGMDVYHDISMKGKSVVGFVASLNAGCTRWFTRTYTQSTKEEIVATLKAAMVACLKKFYETNHFLPGRIFVFRDGVGDGQLSIVRNFEIPQMEEAIINYSQSIQNTKPTVSVVIVQKRINLKVLKRGQNDFENPPPGTIVDHTVTRREFYDFYLVSQHVTQGTVTPTHYVTVYDKNDLTPDRMQRLTYKLTYLYYNFPATIRVPAPCLYAHKAANMIGQYVKRPPSDVLCDKLFYL